MNVTSVLVPVVPHTSGVEVPTSRPAGDCAGSQVTAGENVAISVVRLTQSTLIRAAVRLGKGAGRSC